MKCAWDALISVIPVWMRDTVDKQGRDELQELRLRINKPPLLILNNKYVTMNRFVTKEDLRFCINIVTNYSPWSVSSGINGYYTAPGGHRIGICGTITLSNGQPSVIQDVTSLCIRVSRDFPGITKDIIDLKGSVLIIGAPSCGKTTFLRDFARQLSDKNCVSVIDEKQEIFPQYNGDYCFDTGVNTDVLYGCSKEIGVNLALRNLNPNVIVVDEITAKDDCNALLHAGWCGVDLVATAHASSRKDLFCRTVYQPIVQSGIFQHLIVLKPDKSWYLERM